MTTPWHMARVASRRQLPKPRKMHGPVGERMDTTQVEGVHANSRAGKQCWYGTENGDSAVTACSGCGYHVCNCKPGEPRRRVCGSCNNMVDRHWNYCDDCIQHGKRRPHPNGVDLMAYSYAVDANMPTGICAVFDDHVKHVTAHMQAAERIGICGLCHSAEHKFADCPEYARLMTWEASIKP